MLTVKKTFSLPADTMQTLEWLVPKSKRSRFVNHALSEAIKKLKKQQSMQAIEHFKAVKTTWKSVTETLRNIRDNESKRLIRNQSH